MHSEAYKGQNRVITSYSIHYTKLYDAFFRKKLNINQFIISKPQIYFEVFANFKQDGKEINPKEFYDLLQSYITDINIRNNFV